MAQSAIGQNTRKARTKGSIEDDGLGGIVVYRVVGSPNKYKNRRSLLYLSELWRSYDVSPAGSGFT